MTQQPSPFAGEQLAAFSAAIAALTEAARAVGPGDDLAALDLATGVDAASRPLIDLLAELPRLAEIALLGPAETRIADRAAELAAARAEVARLGRAAEEIRPLVLELRARAEEAERLTAELAELRRLSDLAERLELLREQREALSRRESELSAVAAEEAEFGGTVRRLHALAGDRLAGLEERLRETLAEAAATEETLAVVQARVGSEQDRLERLSLRLNETLDAFDALHAESGRRLPALRAYLAADGDLVTALARGSLTKVPGVHRARDAMEDVERRLQELDEILRPVLKMHDETHAEAREVLRYA